MEDYSPKLQKQRSCSCPALDIGNWCNGRRRTSRFGRGFGNEDYAYDDELEQLDYTTVRSRWWGIWRRIVKEKRKIFDKAGSMHVPYDPYTYAQNFDEGSAWVEPENLSRSFSARFAVPPNMLRRFS